MRPCAVSDKGQPFWPEQAHPAEAFFGMPRRLRLVGDDEITGVVQRNYGTNYAGWVHPLSPHYRLKPGTDPLPVHPRAGLFGYRNWLGVVAAAPGDDLRLRAAVVEAWRERSGPDAPARLIVAGWTMDNMKPRDFTLSSPPLVELTGAPALLLEGMVEAAGQYGLALRAALAPVLAEGEAREAVREAFFAQTQAAFEARLAALTAGAAVPDVAQGWLADMRGTAMALFDEQALAGLADRETDIQRDIIRAREILLAQFAGRGKYGKDAWSKLELQPKREVAA